MRRPHEQLHHGLVGLLLAEAALVAGLVALAGVAAGPAAANPGDWLRFTPPAMQVPLEIETYGGPLAYKSEEDTYTAYGWASSWAPNRKGSPFGPNRVNAERIVVAANHAFERPVIDGRIVGG